MLNYQPLLQEPTIEEDHKHRQLRPLPSPNPIMPKLLGVAPHTQGFLLSKEPREERSGQAAKLRELQHQRHDPLLCNWSRMERRSFPNLILGSFGITEANQLHSCTQPRE